MAVAAIIAAMFNLVHSRLQQTPFPFLFMFGTLSGTSSVALALSITAAIQKRSYWVTFWRMTFHATFGIGILFSTFLVLQGRLACTVSSF